MIKFYKGNPIVIRKTVNGRGSYVVSFRVFYRYSLLNYKVYDEKVTLREGLTITDAYEAIKIMIDDLDNMIKLKC